MKQCASYETNLDKHNDIDELCFLSLLTFSQYLELTIIGRV